jgi:hypothetical protein
MSEVTTRRVDGFAMSQWLSWLIFVAWVSALVYLLDRFVAYDEGHGGARFIALVALAASALVVPRLLRSRWRVRSLPSGIGWACAMLFVGFFALSVGTTANSISVDRQAEMGQINYRAVKLLEQGVNPYGADTYLDFYRYGDVLRRDATPRCISQAPQEAQSNFDRFWRTIDADDMRNLPIIAQSAECAGTRKQFQMMGLKYGPALIASYVPFVTAFGQRGIYVSHLAILTALLVAMWLWTRRCLNLSALYATVPLLLVVVPTVLRYDVLHDSDCDLAPTALAVGAWMLLDGKRERAGGIVVALSIAAKTFPGLFVAPLLLGLSRRAWRYSAATLIVVLGPFAIWDAQGLARNLVLFNLVRETDTTALANLLPRWATSLLFPLFAITWAGLIVWARRRRWTRPASLVCVIGGHLTLFATAKVFHNNYLVWLLPFLGLWVALQLRQVSIRPRSATGPFSASRGARVRPVSSAG